MPLLLWSPTRVNGSITRLSILQDLAEPTDNRYCLHTGHCCQPSFRPSPHTHSPPGTQGAESTAVFTVGVVNPMGFEKCVTTCISGYGILSIFTALETLGNRWSFYFIHSFDFSRIPYSWTHIECGHFRLALLRTNMHLKFLRVSSWLDGSFLFTAD